MRMPAQAILAASTIFLFCLMAIYSYGIESDPMPRTAGAAQSGA